MRVGGDNNIQIGENISYKKTLLKKPDDPWRLIWTAVVAGIVVAAIIGIWGFITKQ